jgi:serine/threonine protein kinase
VTDLLFPPPAEVVGARGRYRVDAFLGRGGFGETYRAHDGAREVTLKVLRLERLDSWKSLELFEREARTLATLDHARVPKIVELFATDGETTRALGGSETVSQALETWSSPKKARVVLVQSYVPGRSLQELIDQGERFDPQRAERLARDLLEVLAYLHGRPAPILHRDLKPSNVILDDQGRAHLIDFGAIQDKIRGASEVGSTLIGTLGYFPQEQILGRALPSSDLYALAMTLVCALTGKPPEDQPMDPATNKVIPPAGLTPNLDRLLRAALEPAPATRPASAASARAILDGQQWGLVLAPPRSQALSTRREKLERALYNTSLAAGVTAAGLMFTVFFDRLSETLLVQLAPFWLAPVIFGTAGKLALPRQGSLRTAAIATGVGLLALFLFLVGIFPAL